ncbi:MAG: hypothetical protein V4687_14210 [Bacteroidota bacterium]
MLYKRTVLLLLFLGLSFISVSQTLNSANFKISDKRKGINFIDLIVNSDILIGISGDGDISYVDAEKDVEYYDGSDKEKAGKVKAIGNIQIDYYDSYDINDPKGKLKSIGNIKVVYNNSFDIHDKFGTLKSIGAVSVKYYNTFDIHDPEGQVKSIGNVNVTYYNSFDDKELFGRIKSIKGNSKSVYVTKFRGRQY